MKLFDVLTDENIESFAFYYYRNPNCTSLDEFQEDLSRFRYLKKLINRYLESSNIQPRLIMNHLIVLFNVFDPLAVHRLMEYKMNDLQLTVVKPFIEFLGYLGANDLCDVVSNPGATESVHNL